MLGWQMNGLTSALLSFVLHYWTTGSTPKKLHSLPVVCILVHLALKLAPCDSYGWLNRMYITLVCTCPYRSANLFYLRSKWTQVVRFSVGLLSSLLSMPYLPMPIFSSAATFHQEAIRHCNVFTNFKEFQCITGFLVSLMSGDSYWNGSSTSIHSGSSWILSLWWPYPI